jgi:hypothetical protein
LVCLWRSRKLKATEWQNLWAQASCVSNSKLEYEQIWHTDEVNI